jgi:hypothetical protein
MRYEGPALRYE